MDSLNLERRSKSRLPYAQQMSDPQQCSPSLNIWNFVFLELLLNILTIRNGGLNSLLTITDALLLSQLSRGLLDLHHAAPSLTFRVDES